MVTILKRVLLFSLLILAALTSACGGGGSKSATQPGGVGTPATWTKLANPFSITTELSAIGSDQQSGALWLGGFGIGMAVSSDGGHTWTQENSGLPAIKVSQIGFNAQGDPVAVDGSNPPVGVFRYTGGAWMPASGLTATFSFGKPVLDLTGAIVEVTAWGADVFRSTDGGNTFTQTASDITGGSGALWCSAVGPDGSLYAAGEAPAGAYISQDNGSTWTAIGPSNASGYTGNITAMIFNSSGQLLAGRTLASDGSGLQRYTGSGWVESAAGLPTFAPITNLCKDSRGNLYALVTGAGAASSNFIYRSTDNGQSWTQFDSGISGEILLLTADNAGHVYAATEPGASSTPAIYTISTSG